MSEAMRDTKLTVDVTLVNDLRFRLGMFLLKLAFRIIGSKVKINSVNKESCE